MFNFIKKWFYKKDEEFDDDPMEDPMMAEVIKRCWNSGKVVSAQRHENGSYDIKEIDLDDTL